MFSFVIKSNSNQYIIFGNPLFSCFYHIKVMTKLIYCEDILLKIGVFRPIPYRIYTI